MSATTKRTGASLARHRSAQDIGTPRVFLDAVELRFGPLCFDLAASAVNAKAPMCFGVVDDSLSQDWTNLPGTLWLNPPFGNIAPWARKCAQSTEAPHVFRRILMLVPASVGSRWFAQYVHGKAMVLALVGRMAFEGHKQTFPKDLMLVEYGGWRGFDTWEWRPARARRNKQAVEVTP